MPRRVCPGELGDRHRSRIVNWDVVAAHSAVRTPPLTAEGHTQVFAGLDHLREENAAFVEFHNSYHRCLSYHRYLAHGGAGPAEIRQGRSRRTLASCYEVPTRLPAKGRIEVVRYVRSNRLDELFGKRITVDADLAHQYVTATSKVRAREGSVVTLDGKIIHEGGYVLSRVLR